MRMWWITKGIRNISRRFLNGLKYMPVLFLSSPPPYCQDFLLLSTFPHLLLNMQSYAMNEQKGQIEEVFEKWKGNLDQIDDVCIIGVRV